MTVTTRSNSLQIIVQGRQNVCSNVLTFIVKLLPFQMATLLTPWTQNQKFCSLTELSLKPTSLGQRFDTFFSTALSSYFASLSQNNVLLMCGEHRINKKGVLKL
ncbi:hypothetical protein AMECASPLE_037905 [Ameca splendens]|uniref:Uncharacterized protein n=1 Tax=Ameca splendens TaxID=208324 RepID=A0ABV1AEF9_9TELE